MSEAKCPECEVFTGRRRAICRNEAGLSLKATNAYRRADGFAEFNADGSVSNRVMPDLKAAAQAAIVKNRGKTLYGPHAGTNLANLLKAVNIPVKAGCTCEEWITKMNNWTIAENIEHRQEIIDHLKERAVDENMTITRAAWTGLLIIFNGVRPTIGGLVDEAIQQAKNVQEKKTPPPKTEIAPQETIDKRFAICKACPHFSGTNCKLCKCTVNAAASLTNKLAHPEESCPIQKWRSTTNPPLIGVPIDRTKLQSHILYHVMPLKGETEWVWQRHLEWLREVRPQFNGRLILGVVTPGRKDPNQYATIEEVKSLCDGLEAEFITAPNDIRGRDGLGEGVLFPQMLEKLKTDDPNAVVFYGHCKGVTRPGPRDGAPQRWATACFDTLFRNQTAAIDALDNHGTCGPFLMRGGFKDGGPGVGSNWFFSGTFFAMRLCEVFKRGWKEMPQHYGCVEQMPRVLFDRDTEAACLFFDGVNNLYGEAYWNETIQPELDKWYANQR